MKSTGKIIGIDLGTTNSCVAIMENNTPKVISNREGNNTTPSIVAFVGEDENEKLVGIPAKRQNVTNPENTFFATKRWMEKDFKETAASISQHPVSYQVVQDKHGKTAVKTKSGKIFTPSQIAAFILTEMKSIAEEKLGTKITQAVVTVPAYFNDAQRQAVKDAGKIAGLEIVRIINEPTAAALAYGLDKNQKQSMKIVVYDLGGGTFDVSILEINEGVFEVLATNGDTYLGGEDFDNKLMQYIVEDFQKKNGLSLDMSKPEILQRVREAAEKAKMELSQKESTDVNIPYIMLDAKQQPVHLICQITRTKFEQLVEDLLQKTVIPCQQVLRDANLKPSDIDEVIVVGGMTRMPKVKATVKKIFGKEPSCSVNPDEAVAVGAAVQAAVLSGDVKDVILLDVIPLSLGIETLGGVLTKLIERNTTIPIKKTQIFSTAADNQTSVSIMVYQGERPMAKDNRLLGKFDLHNIPPAPRGTPQIEVSFDVNANGILDVSAKDLGTGKEQKITVQGSGGLTEAEIEKMRQEAEQFAEEDKKKEELVTMKNKADSLLFTMDSALKENGSKISEELKTSLEEKVKVLRGSMEGDDREEIERAYDALNSESMKMYEEMQKAGGTSPQDTDPQQQQQ